MENKVKVRTKYVLTFSSNFFYLIEEVVQKGMRTKRKGGGQRDAEDKEKVEDKYHLEDKERVEDKRRRRTKKLRTKRRQKGKEEDKY